MKHFTSLRSHVLTILAFLGGMFAVNAQCTYTIQASDSWGDGWNGCTLDISLDGVPTYSYSLPSGLSGTYDFVVGDGQLLELFWTQGSFISEPSYNLLDDGGNNIFSQGSTVPNGLNYTGTVVCTPCISDPSNLDADLFTASTAELSWNGVYGAASYTVEWGISPFTPGTGAELGSATTASTTATATGLIANTTYEFYVQSDCGPTWVGPFVFALPCILTTPAVLPFLEDFESSTAATSYGDAEMHCSPEYKWEFTTDNQAGGRIRFGANAITAQSGTGAFTLDRDPSGSVVANDMILTIDLSSYAVGSNLAINFDYMDHGDESHANDRVWVRGSETDTWIEVYNWQSAPHSIGVWNSVDVLDVSIPLAGAGQSPSSTFQVRFGQQDDFPATSTTASDGLTIDNVEIVNITCPQPTAFNLTGSDLTSGSFAWTEVGGASQWQFEYGTPGFTPGTGTYQISNQNPDTINGLPSNTFYEVYVQSICGVGDSSFWTGPITFNTYNQGLYMEADTDCPLGGFVDISSTGTDLNVTDDGGAGVDPLPFPILFQGLLMTNMYVGNNGGLQLGTNNSYIGYGGTFSTLADGTLFAWGDDLDEETGNVYVQQVGTSPNSILVIQWDNSCNYPGSATEPTVTFQIQIDEATGEIFYVYPDPVFGGTDAADDYAANADIGISGPNQDITISTNNPTYLQNESCVHFYYTDCPKPQNLSVTYTTSSEAAITWNAGLSNETNWTVIYGPEGFDPTATGTTVQTTSTALIIPGLDDATNYDVYVYADCNPGILQSFGTPSQFSTLPNCADVTGLAGTTAVDSIFTSWNFTANPGYNITEFAIEYGLTGFSNGSGTYIWGVDTINYTDTLFDAGLIGGGLYDVYVQSVCGVDSSYWVGPITVTMPLTNDSTCFAEELMVDGTVYTLSNAGATVGATESSIAPAAGTCVGNMTWCNSSMNFTTWFTFVAPPSGNVRIDGESANFDGQVAVYETTDCGDYSQYTILGANDDFSATTTYPFLNLCGLTPGNTYYLVHDPKSTTTTGVYSLRLREVAVDAGSDNGLTNLCLGDVIDLSTQLSGADAGGAWSENIPTAGFNDPMWSSAGLAAQVFTFEYMVVDGCAADSVETTVEVYAPSSAGVDGSVTVCLNEPVDLLSGLSGNVDLGGTWYDPSNTALSSSSIFAGQVPGSFNYDYITGNGVCADDTSNVILIVSPTCNFLDLQENAIEGMEIYPNPTSNVFYISNAGSSEVFNYELTDLNGKVIASKAASINGTETTEVSVANLETGVYLIHIFNENADKTFRVVKQ